MRPVGYDGAPEGVEEGEEEGGGELEEEGGEGGGEALLGEGAVCVVDARGRISLWFSILFCLRLWPLYFAIILLLYIVSSFSTLGLLLTERETEDLQKNNPFHILRRSVVVNGRPDVR